MATPAKDGIKDLFSISSTVDENGATVFRKQDIAREQITIDETPTITAGTYTDGYVIGAKLTFELAVRVEAKSSELVTALILDKSGQNCPMDLILFDSDLTATTPADNTALTLGNADLARVIMVLRFKASDYRVIGSKSAADRAVRRGIKLASGTSLYGVLICRQSEGTPPTFASTTDLTVRLGIQK